MNIPLFAREEQEGELIRLRVELIRLQFCTRNSPLKKSYIFSSPLFQERGVYRGILNFHFNYFMIIPLFAREEQEGEF